MHGKSKSADRHFPNRDDFNYHSPAAKGQKVYIVGGGFTGLTLAYYLARRSFQVHIYEATERVGGLINTLPTHQKGLGFFETAANGLLKSPLVERLFLELGVPIAKSVPIAQRRFIWRKELKRWPLTAGESLALFTHTLLPFLFKKDSLRPTPGMTLDQWGKCHLPSEAQHFLLETGLQGIYGAHTKNLSASLVLKGIFQKDKPRYRGLIAPKFGMKQLIDGLVHQLKNLGVIFHLNSPLTSEDIFHIRQVEPQTPWILCTKAPEAAQLLGRIAPQTAEQMSKIRMHNKTTCTIFYEHFPENKKQWGFGCLLPPSSPVRWPLGILMNSFIFAGRDKCYSENWIFADDAKSFLQGTSEREMIDFLKKTRGEIFGESLPIKEIGLRHWIPALPVYDVILEDVLEKIQLPKNIYLNGNYLGEIGLTAILQRSWDLALNLAQSAESQDSSQ